MSLQEKLKELNKALETGDYNEDLDFSFNPPMSLTQKVIDDVCSIAFYKEYAVRKRFPYADDIIGMNAVVDLIINDIKHTPLEELTERKNISLNNIENNDG
jgi:hypothetical protein